MSITFVIEEVTAWGQRVEPKPNTLIGLTHYFSHEAWSEIRTTSVAYKKSGLYLGRNLVVIPMAGIETEILRVTHWGQRDEPNPQTPIYQNTNEPSFDNDWRSVPVSIQDRVGIYLGGGLVLVGKLK